MPPPRSDAGRREQRRYGWRAPAAGALLLVALTVLAHLPALRNGTVWDDDDVVFANPLVHAPDGLRRFWLATSTPDYFPLSSTVQWIEWRLWGENPRGYHAVNLGLHALTALVLWRVLARLAVPFPWVAAAVFAVHPVTVASVAWISELKNVLSLCLAATALLAYLRFEDGGMRRDYALALVAFTLALLAKTSVVMLPILLLLLAWYRRRRIAVADLRHAAPFFALALVAGLATIRFQHNAIGVADVRPEGVLSRVAAAGWVVWFYLGKDLLPLDLSMIYPRWRVDAGWLPAWLPLLGVGALCAVAWRRRDGWGRPLLVALGSFVIVLAPVLGLVAMCFHQHSLVSDHLQYVALIVPIALVVGSSAALVRRYANGKTAALVAAVTLVALSALTWQRARVFANEWTLWTDTIAKNPSAWGAHHGLGDVLARAGRFEEAMRYEREALRLNPDAAEAHNNLALALASQGDLEGAETHYREALRLNSAYAEAYNNLGVVLARSGRNDEAEAHYRQALSLNGAYVEAHSNLGNLLVRNGRVDDGTSHLALAARLAPNRAELHNNLGIALGAQGRHEAAIAEYEGALRLAPTLAQAHYNLGGSLLHLRRFREAATEYRQALLIDPTLQPAQQGLDVALRMASDGRGGGAAP